MNPGAQTYQINLQRSDPGETWGIRLQGGTDFAEPLSVGMVNAGSLADRYGLKAGDAVLQINGRNSGDLSHEDAKYEFLRAGNSLNLLVQRGVVSIWKPQVTQLDNLRPAGGPDMSAARGYNDDPYTQRTSLAANKQDFMNIGGNYNRSPRPFPGSGGGPPAAPPPQQQPVNIGGYTPIGGYGGGGGGGGGGQGYGPPPQSYGQPPQQYAGAPSPGYGGGGGYGQQQNNPATTNLSEPTLRLHDESQSQPAQSQPAQSQPAQSQPAQSPAFRQMEDQLMHECSPMAGFRSVNAPKDKPPGERKQAEYMTCKACGGLCVGVFVRIKGNPLHPECFKCVTCGKNLKNQGHYEVEGKLYCDVHAAQAAGPPQPGMTPVYR